MSGTLQRRMILLTLLLACGTAHAEEWVSLGKHEGMVEEVFVDVSSIRVVGEIRRAWIKGVYVPGRFVVHQGEKTYWGRDSEEFYSFNCARKSFRLEASIRHFTDEDKNFAPQMLPDRTRFVDTDTLPWRSVAHYRDVTQQWRFICAWKSK
jgi:hypothetical protein